MTEAPRWRLMTAHYLKVPGTEWEYKEADRTTGKQARRVFEVPVLLDPHDSNDCNYPGECIVTHAVDGVRGQSRDIVFIGDPTPDMEPMNDAAQAITDALAPKWVHPIESLTGNGLSGDFASQLLADLQAQLSEAMTKSGGLPQAQAASGVSQAEFDALKAELATMREAPGVKADPIPVAGRRA